MAPKVDIYGIIPMQKKKFVGKMGPKRGQKDPNGSKQDQVGSNRAKPDPMVTNSVKQGKHGPNWAKQGQLVLTGAIWSQLGPVMAFI